MICTECGRSFAAGHEEDVCEGCQCEESEEMYRQSDDWHDEDDEGIDFCEGCGAQLSPQDFEGGWGYCGYCREEPDWEDDDMPEKGKAR